jgi:hypothetical protein
VKLKIRRLGGIAGVTLHTQLDTGELPAAQAQAVEAAVQGLADEPPSGPPHPDGFRYEITPLDQADPTPVTLAEHEVPPALKPLTEAVRESGEIERREPPASA